MDTWWQQEALETQVRETLEEILQESQEDMMWLEEQTVGARGRQRGQASGD